MWDDQAGEPVSKHVFATGVAAHLSPEQALARLRGTNPNGVWTISVSDPVDNDTYGVFESATLRVTALPQAPAWTVTNVTDTPPSPIAIPNGPAGAPITRTRSIANPGGAPIGDVVLTTDIPHEWSGDLDITLTSPRGTLALITSGNPRGASAMFDNVFAGTIWSVLGPPVTQEVMVDGTAEFMLGAEEPLSVFAGEDPHGVWTLSIRDRYNHPGSFNVGELVSWSLGITTYACNFVPHTVETDGNTSIDAATPLVMLSGVAGVGMGSAFPTGDADYWSFDAPAGARAWALVDTGGPQNNGVTSRDSLLTLLGPSVLIEIDEDDGIANGADTTIEGHDASTIAGAPLMASGTHHWVVREQSHGTIDPYRLYTLVSTSAPTTVLKRAWHPGSEGESLLAGAGQAFGYYRSSIAGDADVFRVEDAPKDALLVVWVDGNPTRLGPSLDVVVRLDDDDDPMDAPLMLVDSSGAGPTAAESFVYRVPSAGHTSYYVHVTSGGIGGYEIAGALLVGPSVDLRLTSTVPPATSVAGTERTVTYTVGNVGPAAAGPVSFRSVFSSSETEGAFSAAPGWTCALSGIERACTIPGLAAGAMASFTHVTRVRPDAAPSTIRTGGVIALQTDPLPNLWEINQSNNAAVFDSTITQASDLLRVRQWAGDGAGRQ